MTKTQWIFVFSSAAGAFFVGRKERALGAFFLAAAFAIMLCAVFNGGEH